MSVEIPLDNRSVSEKVRLLERVWNMAVYECECRQCKRTFTATRTISEHDGRKKPNCPKYSSACVQQVINPAFAKTSQKS